MNAEANNPAAFPKIRGKGCVHCGRRCGTVAGGYATVAGNPVCSKPTEDGRPDCYRMVTVKFHTLRDCSECFDSTVDRAWPSPVRMSALKLSSATGRNP